jgi:hypothetical protein
MHALSTLPWPEKQQQPHQLLETNISPLSKDQKYPPARALLPILLEGTEET